MICLVLLILFMVVFVIIRFFVILKDKDNVDVLLNWLFKNSNDGNVYNFLNFFNLYMNFINF